MNRALRSQAMTSQGVSAPPGCCYHPPAVVDIVIPAQWVHGSGLSLADMMQLAVVHSSLVPTPGRQLVALATLCPALLGLIVGWRREQKACTDL